MIDRHPKIISFSPNLDSEASMNGDTPEEIAFMARILVLATLPHNDPGDLPVWGRCNGDMSLTIQPRVKLVENAPYNCGLPYGIIPRLLMIWVTTEAVRTKQRKLVLGNSLSEFMEKLDMAPTGGRWGSITRLRDQMNRLFQSSIAYSFNDETLDEGEAMLLSKKYKFFWDHKNPNQRGLFESFILLDQDFFNEIISRPVPLNMEAIAALRKSPLGLDLYVWLTYRVSFLKKKQPISWSSFQKQFGSNYSDQKEFTRKAKRQIEKILALYPDLNIDLSPRGRFILYPSKTHVAKRISG